MNKREGIISTIFLILVLFAGLSMVNGFTNPFLIGESLTFLVVLLLIVSFLKTHNYINEGTVLVFYLLVVGLFFLLIGAVKAGYLPAVAGVGSVNQVAIASSLLYTILILAGVVIVLAYIERKKLMKLAKRL
jgi:prolipoprotein diacylglyceryltransferase